MDQIVQYVWLFLLLLLLLWIELATIHGCVLDGLSVVLIGDNQGHFAQGRRVTALHAALYLLETENRSHDLLLSTAVRNLKDQGTDLLF